MIKINLLPSKRKPPRKVTELQQQLILGSLILALVSIGMWFYWNHLNTKIDDLRLAKIAAEAKIRDQDNMLKQVNTVETERKKVAEKINVIEQLKKNQGMLARLLDEVSKALPQGVNLASLSENAGKISLDGMAFTNHEIVRFVDNLKASPFCSDVYLQETVQSVQDGIEIYKYRLQFTFKEV